MDKPVFPPRSPPQTGKGDVPISPSPDGETTTAITLPFYTSASPYQETNTPPINPYLTPISSIHAIIFIFIFSFLFLQLLLIFHFIIKPLPHSAYLSSPPVGDYNPLTPPPSSTPHSQLTSDSILQFNCNGILHCMQELSSLLQLENIRIACIQESKLKSPKILPIIFFPN